MPWYKSTKPLVVKPPPFTLLHSLVLSPWWSPLVQVTRSAPRGGGLVYQGGCRASASTCQRERRGQSRLGSSRTADGICASDQQHTPRRASSSARWSSAAQPACTPAAAAVLHQQLCPQPSSPSQPGSLQHPDRAGAVMCATGGLYSSVLWRHWPAALLAQALLLCCDCTRNPLSIPAQLCSSSWAADAA
jgi:hypothetical protein